MLYFIIKIVITATIVVIVAEIAKKSSLFAGLIVSIPITTFLALFWLYWETEDIQKIINLSNSTLLMIIPSISFFIFLPIILKLNTPFIISMFISALLTSFVYYIFLTILQKTGLISL